MQQMTVPGFGTGQHTGYITSVPVYRPDFNAIPNELKLLNQWVLWRYERDGDGKKSKVPYQVNGKRAKVNDPSTWASFEEVKAEYERGDYEGILFALTKNDPYTIIDFDDCLDSRGTLDKRVERLMGVFKSYTETSPSGNGIHIVVKAKITKNRKEGKVEIYDHGRFMSFTGHFWDGYAHYGIQSVPWAYSELFPEADDIIDSDNNFVGVEDTNALTKADKALLRTMFSSANGEKIEKLWGGDWSEYKSQSEADLSLCSSLAWWTNYVDPARVDRFFRRSKLYREKWDETRRADGATYGHMTLENAFRGKEAGGGYTHEGKAQANEAAASSDTTGLTFTDYFSEDAEEVTPPEMLVSAPISLPLGYVAAIGGLGGTGKSVLAARIGVSVALGIDFLTARVKQGNVLYLDFELDDCVTIPRFQGICRGLGVEPKQLDNILEYKSLTSEGLLFGNVLPDLKITLEKMQPKLVIIDAYQAAFGGDPSDREKVPENIKTLAALAITYGCAVLFLDHKPKDQKGFSSSTLYGSAYKQNFSRSVAMLSQTPSGVLKYETVKANFSQKAPPFGISCEWTKNDWGQDVIRFSHADLEDSETLTNKDKIIRAVSLHLEENSGLTIPRKTLIEIAHGETGTGTGYCQKVLDAWLADEVRLGRLIEHKMGGRGNPKGYEMPLFEY